MRERKDPRIAAYMRKRREEMAAPEIRAFPKLGTFCTTKEYVEKYYAMNGLTGASGETTEDYVAGLFGPLSTEPVTL
jgi:hypothetical protein